MFGVVAGWRRWTAVAIGVVLLAAVVVSRVDVANPRVHVRWRGDIPADRRAVLERRYGLRQGVVVDERTGTWQYRLDKLTRENIRAIVEDRWIDDTAYIDRREFTASREVRILWYPLSDLLNGPAQLLELHQSLWLLLAGGGLLLTARATSAPLRRNVSVAALLFVGSVAVAWPHQPSRVTMGGSAGRTQSRADFDYFFGNRVRFEKHLSQVILLQIYDRLEPTDSAPAQALTYLTRLGTAWFLLSAFVVGILERWSPLVLRYLGLVLLAPVSLLFFGWREFGYLSLSAAAFPLLARGLRDDGRRLEAGSAFAGVGAALHGTGLVSLAGAGLAALGAPGRPMDHLHRALRVTAWGTAAYLGWLAIYMIVLRLPVAPDPAPMIFSSWRPWTIDEVRGGRVAAALWSSTSARDLLMSAWVIGAPLLVVAASLWTRHRHDVRIALIYSVPSIAFVIFRWPYDGVGGGMDLVAAGFPALYALVWVCAHDVRRASIAAVLLASGHYAFWRVVLDKNFIP